MEPQDDYDEHPRKKRKKGNVTFTDAQEEALRDWFQENPLFYDQSKREFKNKVKKDRMVKWKARELGVTGMNFLPESLC